MYELTKVLTTFKIEQNINFLIQTSISFWKFILINEHMLMRQTTLAVALPPKLNNNSMVKGVFISYNI